jgi:hypothetical protein
MSDAMISEESVAKLMLRLGAVKADPPRAVGTRSRWARFPWKDWAKLLRMAPDQSFLLHTFDNPTEAGKARASRVAEDALPKSAGYRLTAVTLKATDESQLFGIYEPPITRHDSGNHLKRRDSPR